MAITNHERIGKALDLAKAGLAPFIERELQEVGEHISGAINRELGRDVKTAELPAGVAAALLSYVLFAVNDNKSRIIIDASHISPTIN